MKSMIKLTVLLQRPWELYRFQMLAALTERIFWRLSKGSIENSEVQTKGSFVMSTPFIPKPNLVIEQLILAGAIRDYYVRQPQRIKMTTEQYVFMAIVITNVMNLITASDLTELLEEFGEPKFVARFGEICQIAFEENSEGLSVAKIGSSFGIKDVAGLRLEQKDNPQATEYKNWGQCLLDRVNRDMSVDLVFLNSEGSEVGRVDI